MISERAVANGFHSFWSELFPFLTPDFIRIFNGTHAAPLLDAAGYVVSALPMNVDVRHYDIVAETAFQLARAAIHNRVNVAASVGNAMLRQQAIERTRKLLFKVHQGDDDHFVLTEYEWTEVGDLVARYYMFLVEKDHLTEALEFEPAFPGMGFVGECRGDLSIGKILYEVKTVNRNVHAKDLRQLILYLALEAGNGSRRWEFGGFFNPRKGQIYRFHIEDLCEEISGGKTGMEVFGQISDFLGSRDVDLDRAF